MGEDWGFFGGLPRGLGSATSHDDLEGFRAKLYDLEWAFIGALESHTVSIATDENEFSLVQVPRYRGEYSTML